MNEGGRARQPVSQWGHLDYMGLRRRRRRRTFRFSPPPALQSEPQSRAREVAILAASGTNCTMSFDGFSSFSVPQVFIFVSFSLLPLQSSSSSVFFLPWVYVTIEGPTSLSTLPFPFRKLAKLLRVKLSSELFFFSPETFQGGAGGGGAGGGS